MVTLFDIVFVIIRRQCTILSLTALFALVLTANIYFVYVIVEDKSPSIPTSNDLQLSRDSGGSLITTAATKKKPEKMKQPLNQKPRPVEGHRNATFRAVQKIREKLVDLADNYKKISQAYKPLLNKLLEDLKPSLEISVKLWATADKWIGAREIIPEAASALGSMLRTLCSTKIIHAENAKQGTQLKLMFTLAGEQKAIFKPQWYPRSELIEGPVYAGKDRHNAEVAAFHLSILLGLRRSPLTVGRKVNLRREVMPVASADLVDTFYQEGNNTCFYGVCYYCSPQDPVCAKKDVMEGALIMWLPSDFKLKKYRNPWQRTYKTHTVARWEMDEHYCDKIKATRLYNPETGPRLLDLIDAAVFDFLIDNGDRHHYEVLDNVTNSVVLLLDNGKSFGNPQQDHLDILAPLYQCCMLRKSTWDRLQLFSGNTLSMAMEALLQHSHIAPVLTLPHLRSLDRRLLLVFAAVETCFSQLGKDRVLVYDAVS